MEYIKAFLIGGLICAAVQILMDKTKLLPGRIMVLLVVTGAVLGLSLIHIYLNKYHIEARNLLGLIYYEMGEISEALVQWVISMNFQENDNRADHYLEQIQRKPERLEVVSQNVKKYNLALQQAQSGSDDLAVLQLTRVVEANPKFIKACLLYTSRCV